VPSQLQACLDQGALRMSGSAVMALAGAQAAAVSKVRATPPAYTRTHMPETPVSR